jgi:cysteine desulfurase
LHADASQAPLFLPFDLTRLSADTVALDAQKAGGVRGIGVLLKRDRVKLAAVTHGGGQEGGLRPGTEPVALAAAFAAALTASVAGQERFREQAGKARQELIASVREAIPDALVNEGCENAPHIVNFSFPGRDTDYLVMLLDRAGFAVSTKSACEADSDEGSRAVLALTHDEARARSTLRLSWGPATAARDLRRAVPALVNAIRFIDSA